MKQGRAVRVLSDAGGRVDVPRAALQEQRWAAERAFDHVASHAGIWLAEPDAVLALAKPDDALVLVRTMYHYARAVALARKKDAAGARAEPTADRQGELLYRLRQDCGSCHGMTLKGGLGPALLPDALAARSENDLAAVILNGVLGTPMPPWDFEIH